MFNSTISTKPQETAINPLTFYLKKPTPFSYDRLGAIPNGITVYDEAVKHEVHLKDVLIDFIKECRLLTPQIRAIVLKINEKDPTISYHYPLSFPFRYNNNVETETIKGTKRYVTYFDNEPIKIQRFKEIPLNETSPINYSVPLLQL